MPARGCQGGTLQKRRVPGAVGSLSCGHTGSWGDPAGLGAPQGRLRIESGFYLLPVGPPTPGPPGGLRVDSDPYGGASCGAPQCPVERQAGGWPRRDLKQLLRSPEGLDRGCAGGARRGYRGVPTYAGVPDSQPGPNSLAFPLSRSFLGSVINGQVCAGRPWQENCWLGRWTNFLDMIMRVGPGPPFPPAFK